MTRRYIIAMDKNRDGDFADVSEDIAGETLELRWRLGMRQPYDSIADYSQAQIRLRNPRGDFSPERNQLDIGARLRIQSRDGQTTRTHFTGFIRYIKPEAGDWGQKQALIHLQDVQPWLDDSPVRPAPQVNTTADAVIDSLLDQATLRPESLAGYCIIDVVGYNQIDSVKIFPPQTLARRLAVGKTRFAYVGDWWSESTSVRQAIRELAESERGRFYIDREGRAVFLNRHHTLVHKTVAASFDDDMDGLDYRYGDDGLNRISLLLTPREAGGGGTLLWQLTQAQAIGQKQELTLNLRFVDERNAPLGLLELERLEASFHRRPDRSGDAIQGPAAVEIVEVGWTSVQVQVRNRGAQDVYLTGLRVIGRPLYRRDPLEIVVSDAESITFYGLKQMSLDLPALSDIETAQAFAAYEVARRKPPVGAVRTLTLNANDHPNAALNLSLFERIRITESQTGQRAAEYFIIAEEHHVSLGGARHEVAWTLEPADSTRFVIVDSSQIDSAQEVIVPY